MPPVLGKNERAGFLIAGARHDARREFDHRHGLAQHCRRRGDFKPDQAGADEAGGKAAEQRAGQGARQLGRVGREGGEQFGLKPRIVRQPALFEGILQGQLGARHQHGEFGAGGTMARLADEGVEVRYVAFSIATRSLPEGFAPDTLRHEVAAATSPVFAVVAGSAFIVVYSAFIARRSAAEICAAISVSAAPSCWSGNSAGAKRANASNATLGRRTQRVTARRTDSFRWPPSLACPSSP